MAYFPMCVELKGRTVLLVGGGGQIREKAEKLAPFGAELRRLDTLCADDLACRPAFVIAGDLPESEAERIAALCKAQGVPVNVVDQPRLCSFCFSALLVRGDVTVSVSTGGKAPGAAACLKERMESALPEKTEEILDWLAELRIQLRQRHPGPGCARLMRNITAAAFEKGDVLTPQELQNLTDETE